ncbi:MAG TPA: hypothetical protein VKE74_14140 [Gemmataceae bacterium]|nr:hypothetical protein [Gemmataceae bacterium]
MSVSWLPGLAGSASFLAGVVASFCLILLPAALLLRGEPGREVDEFKRAHPRRAWLVDWFLPATAVTMLGLWMIPVKFYVDPALGGVDPATRWIVTSAVFGFTFFQWLFLPMSGLELATGMTLAPRGNAPQGWRVIDSPRVRWAGLFRLALTLAAFGAAAGLVEAFRT